MAAKFRIPKSVAQELVDSGQRTTGKSVQRIPRAPAQSEPQVALVQVVSEWTDGHASAVLISSNGRVASGQFELYAPTAGEDANLPNGLCHAAYIDGRWEVLLMSRLYPTYVVGADSTITVSEIQSSPFRYFTIAGNYQAGDGIYISGNVIRNTGVLSISDSSRTKTGSISLNSPLALTSYGAIYLKEQKIYGRIVSPDTLELYIGEADAT